MQLQRWGISSTSLKHGTKLLQSLGLMYRIELINVHSSHQLCVYFTHNFYTAHVVWCGPAKQEKGNWFLVLFTVAHARYKTRLIKFDRHVENSEWCTVTGAHASCGRYTRTLREQAAADSGLSDGRVVDDWFVDNTLDRDRNKGCISFATIMRSILSVTNYKKLLFILVDWLHDGIIPFRRRILPSWHIFVSYCGGKISDVWWINRLFAVRLMGLWLWLGSVYLLSLQRAKTCQSGGIGAAVSYTGGETDQYSAGGRLPGDEFAGPVLRLGRPADLRAVVADGDVSGAAGAPRVDAGRRQSDRPACPRRRPSYRAAAQQPRHDPTEKHQEQSGKERDQARTQERVPLAIVRAPAAAAVRRRFHFRVRRGRPTGRRVCHDVVTTAETDGDRLRDLRRVSSAKPRVTWPLRRHSMTRSSRGLLVSGWRPMISVGDGDGDGGDGVARGSIWQEMERRRSQRRGKCQ